MDEAARIAIETVGAQLSGADTGVREVLLVLYDQGSYDVHSRAAQALFGGRIK
jgi:O-acetyl-ADP-ribose deacetylase (regulator of RNase III)